MAKLSGNISTKSTLKRNMEIFVWRLILIVHLFPGYLCHAERLSDQSQKKTMIGKYYNEICIILILAEILTMQSHVSRRGKGDLKLEK